MAEEPLNKVFTDTVIRGLEEANTSIKNLQTKSHANDVTLASVNAELASIRRDVNELVTIIRGNNAKETLVNRVMTLENDQKSIQQYIDGHKKTVIEHSQSKWQFKTAVATAVIAFIGTIVSLLVNLFK